MFSSKNTVCDLRFPTTNTTVTSAWDKAVTSWKRTYPIHINAFLVLIHFSISTSDWLSGHAGTWSSRGLEVRGTNNSNWLRDALPKSTYKYLPQLRDIWITKIPQYLRSWSVWCPLQLSSYCTGPVHYRGSYKAAGQLEKGEGDVEVSIIKIV